MKSVGSRIRRLREEKERYPCHPAPGGRDPREGGSAAPGPDQRGDPAQPLRTRPAGSFERCRVQG